MDAKLKAEKLKMWQGKLKKLQDELEAIMVRRGEAIAMGDLSENAAFSMAEEDAITWRVRIEEIEKIIKTIEDTK
ncbi:MAG: hypothetical protein PHQ59_01365 [Candidatus Daviesbacteria bacterium]|nr:hypothetical protein [Candidatus Daviesbacteria bacterium]